MSEPVSVKIIEECRVAPSHGAIPKSLPLTFFDIFWLKFPPVERLFFYEISNPNTSFSDSILPKLKHSLSLTLQHFLPLAGNLTWPEDSHKPIIQYLPGDSVSLTIAESDADFYHLSGNNIRQAIESHPLVPPFPRSPTRVPGVALQVTLFPNCGFCIGVATHHAVFDGKSASMFVKSWAQICKFGGDSSLSPELTPFFDRTILKGTEWLDTIYANKWLNQDGPNNRSLWAWEQNAPPDAIRGTFELSRQDLEKLRTSVSVSINQEKQPCRISTFAIACAYSWVCFVKAKGLKDTKVVFGIPADSRARLEPPLPETYFGNCLGGRGAVLEANQLLRENGFAIAVQEITESIRSLDDGVLKGAEKWFSTEHKVHSTGEFVSIAGSPRFELYKTDFGWGKPKKVELVSIDKTGAICFTDSRDGGGGIEVGIVLKNQEMGVFDSLFAKGLQLL